MLYSTLLIVQYIFQFSKGSELLSRAAAATRVLLAVHAATIKRRYADEGLGPASLHAVALLCRRVYTNILVFIVLLLSFAGIASYKLLCVRFPNRFPN